MPLPKHTALRCTEPGHSFQGETCFVHTVEGEVTDDGFVVPSGWVEVVFDPNLTSMSGFYTELLRREHVCVNGC